MDARLFRFRRGQVLVCRPRDEAFGLLVVDILISLQVARDRGASLYFIPGRRVRHSPLFRLASREVTIVSGPTPLTVVVRGRWYLAYAFLASSRLLTQLWNTGIDRSQDLLRIAHRILERDFVLVPLEIVRRRVRRALRVVRRKPKQPSLKKKLKYAVISGREWLESLRIPKHADSEIYAGLDVRRTAALHPLNVYFPERLEARARHLAMACGLPPDARIVTLHVREQHGEGTGGERLRDAARNARVETYLPAIDFLVNEGYIVVRIGDPSMTPLAHAGVLDLATHAKRDPLLDLWCVSNSAFFIASDSGPYQLSWLFNVPTLSINVTNILTVFPLRPRDRHTLKLVEDVASGTVVPLSDMLTEEFIYNLRNRVFKERTLRYIDNTSEDILDAVREMVAGLSGAPPLTPAPARFRVLLEGVRAGEFTRSKFQTKMGLEESYLGDGRIVDAFARRYLDAPIERRQARA